jgi:hypothetical protein
LKELDRIAKSAQTEWSGKPARADALLARNIDSCLYAQDDYPDSRPEKVAELAT